MGKLVELMPMMGGLSPEEIDARIKGYMSESGIDVDAAFIIGNSIMSMAVQANEPPEQTVVGAFITGLSLGAKLGRDGMLNP